MAQVKQAHKAHNRAMRRSVFPVVIVGVILVVIPLVLVIAAPQSIGTVASFMAALILFPVVLACLIPYAILIALIVGMVWVNRKASFVLDTILRFSYSVNTTAV